MCCSVLSAARMLHVKGPTMRVTNETCFYVCVLINEQSIILSPCAAGMTRPTITDEHCEVSYSIPGSSTGLEVWN